MAILAMRSGLAMALLAAGAAGSLHAATPTALPAQQSQAAGNGNPTQMSNNGTLDVRTKIAGSSAFTGVAWSPNGGRLAAYANFGRAVQIWNASGVEQRQLSRAGAYIGNALAFTPDGHGLITPAADDSAAGDKLALTIWDLNRGTIARDVAGPFPSQNWRYNRAVAFALSPDGATLALISSPLLGQPVTLYATKNWTIERSIPIGDGPKHPDGAQAVAFSPDGRTLGIGLLGGTVLLVDLSQPEAAARVIEIYPAEDLAGVQALAFSPDGTMLATGATKPSVARGDAMPGLEVRRVADGSLLAKHDGALAPIRQVTWCPDGRLVVAAGDDTMRIWSPASPDHDLASVRLGGPVMSTAIAPDGRALAAAGGSELTIFALSD
jgi:WD40 repeat protein